MALGGPGAEREVSATGGVAIAEAVTSIGHTVPRADISPDALSGLGVETEMFFVALHGVFGEDGQLQRILEKRELPFCGSGSAASELEW